MLVLVLLWFAFVVFSCQATTTTWLYNSCNELDDGLRYIQPSKDSNIIPVICDNGYTMIDISLNKDAYSPYFSSLYLYNDSNSGIYGTDCTDMGSWRTFWTPSKYDTTFRTAVACSSCASSNSYGDNTAYYMTNYYHCLNKMRSNACKSSSSSSSSSSLTYVADNPSQSMCNLCDDNGKTDTTGKWTDCYSLQLDADVETDPTHDNCVLSKAVIVRPAVVGDRSVCQCYQIATEKIRKYKLTSTDDLPLVSNANNLKTQDGLVIDDLIIWDDDDTDSDTASDSDDTDSDGCSSATFYLSNDDFKTGTLQIKECGEYILSEDILINFNAPNKDDIDDYASWSPNTIDLDDLYWFPSTEQADDDTGDYPGLDSFRSYYQMGFFTAISIQTDQVTINLNGFELAMDYEFYLQQRFFSLIELGDRQFISDQGPANFGRGTFSYKSNIKIKDGTLGLTSHQGIHGNNAVHLTISDVTIKNFDVCGIQCNGCRFMTVENAVVGPQNSDIPVMGRYLHARALLPRLRYFVEEHGTETVAFGTNNEYKEDVTVSELAEDIIKKMDMIYFHVMDGREYSDDDEDWIDAKKIFINEDGWLDGGSSYGILINGAGTGVVAFGRRKTSTNDHIFKNVEIYGIYTEPRERFWTAPHSFRQTQGFFFDTLDWKAITNDEGKYIGDPYTDIVFAADKLMQSEFCFMNTLYVGFARDWVFEEDGNLDELTFHCGSDVQSHDAKGSMGLRIDSSTKFTITDLYVHDIVNRGQLGDEETCGEYEVIQFLHDVYQDIEPGYTGNRAHGILIDFAKGSFSGVTIENVESYYGAATGMSIYKGSTISKIANVAITKVTAGSQMVQDDVDALNVPNYAPFACSVHIGDSDDDGTYVVTIRGGTTAHSITADNIAGFDLCDDDHILGTMTLATSDDDTDDTEEEVFGFAKNVNIGRSKGNVHVWYYAMFGVLCLLVLLIRVAYPYTKKKFELFNSDSQNIDINYGTF